MKKFYDFKSRNLTHLNDEVKAAKDFSKEADKDFPMEAATASSLSISGSLGAGERLGGSLAGDLRPLRSPGDRDMRLFA